MSYLPNLLSTYIRMSALRMSACSLLDTVIVCYLNICLHTSYASGRSIEDYRAHLGSYGITGELALRPITSLSGGQKSRLAFSLMTVTRYMCKMYCLITPVY